MRFATPLCLLLLLLAALVAKPLPSHAQQGGRGSGKGTVLVTVADDSTGRPLEGARARLLEHPSLERTGADGVARLSGVPSGPKVLEVTLPGYRMKRTQVMVPVGDTVRLAVRLVPQLEEVVLEGLKVTSWGRSRQLTRTGFYERQGTWRGNFVTGEEIYARRASRMRDLFNTMRGFVVIPYQGDDILTTTRTVGRGGGLCIPAIYLDGMPSAMDAVMTMSPDDVEGIEAYPSPSSTPPEYTTSRCGAVVVWTKR